MTTSSNNYDNDLNDDHENHQARVEYIVRAITNSRSVFVEVVTRLLADLRTLDSGGYRIQRQKTLARKSIESQDFRPVTPVGTSAPITLLDIIAQSQIPGIKRKRSITHISSIAISSILPHPAPASHSEALTTTAHAGQNGGKGKGQIAVGGNGRAIVVRKRVGLGRMFSGLGVRSGDGVCDTAGDGETDDETDSDEDDDLIIIV